MTGQQISSYNSLKPAPDAVDIAIATASEDKIVLKTSEWIGIKRHKFELFTQLYKCLYNFTFYDISLHLAVAIVGYFKINHSLKMNKTYSN